MGGLSLLKMALAYPDSLHDIAGIIAHAPWITTYSNRRPNKFLSLLINILYYIYPQFKVNTGLKISEAPYPEEYKKMAIATGHLKSTITIDVTKSSFTAMDYVIQHYDKYPDIPLLLLQGEADDCVSPTKNIKWANKVKELKGDIIEIVDYKEGPHDLLKSGTRKRAFEDMFSFVERVSNKPKDQKETKKQTTNDEL
ncbi:Clan SC, family S33, methylesterase-like serine peptidase [Histomonas meleagridis]|uniref:Clan SC, family S33, methylesterase-like serine peptidase n=1 Tax=Histomonas meleagridis TaxID=135588 RepID=UPI0035597F37|nr:Clan SC, family S33, methylesterase-like serine peptidase [Histomonas meleagridis]KAH0804489.1 Clan SC, family S33, methylesterase-like serine peptidase [Histomonas meleagridis]